MPIINLRRVSRIFLPQLWGYVLAECYSELSVNSYQVTRRHIPEDSELLCVVITVGTEVSLWIHVALENTATKLWFCNGKEILCQQSRHMFSKKSCFVWSWCLMVGWSFIHGVSRNLLWIWKDSTKDIFYFEWTGHESLTALQSELLRKQKNADTPTALTAETHCSTRTRFRAFTSLVTSA
jgi:hypothetical protein